MGLRVEGVVSGLGFRDVTPRMQNQMDKRQ